jgi:hypothetical protein
MLQSSAHAVVAIERSIEVNAEIFTGGRDMQVWKELQPQEVVHASKGPSSL